MSSENLQSVEPSLLEYGEGRWDRTLEAAAKSGGFLNDAWSGHRYGVVRGVRMQGQGLGVRGEIHDGGWRHPTAGSSGAIRCKAGLPVVEVGEARSSDEGGNDAGAKEPHSVNANSEGKDW